ncbi:putative E3 ubiquitin-protein ligase RING1b isoform X1 [Haliotis rufescens]|uniref:putative E3 ubiquitin-protein ligase RING1b isoform X1 n=1 Tax=Haliotis rufescens TaxID=6454 RepID=UPI001EB09207|nr:putative E3 ubiquitin-protein ligase RING1b isoform X1 [Haliotis rufescens]
MAMASPQEEDPLTEDLNCPICLELLNEPVTLYNCFHSFCRRCLQQSILGARETYRNPYACPQCRRRFVPSDGDKVNHHLQNIVNSHRKAQERIAEIRQYEMQDLKSQSRGGAVAAAETTEKPSKVEFDHLTSFLSTVDTKLQSLLTALDQSSINAGGMRKGVSDKSSEHSTIVSERVQDHPRPSVEEVNRTQPPNTQEHHIDCDFEAESVGEFLERSLVIIKKHFLLIMFLIHACALIFCFLMGVL